MPPGGGSRSVLGSTLLFSSGPAMLPRPSRLGSEEPLAPLPFDPAMWAWIVRELKLPPQLAATGELVLRGYQCKEIAKRLGLGEPTVRTYLGRLYARAWECGAAAKDHTHFILFIVTMVVHRLSGSASCHSVR